MIHTIIVWFKVFEELELINYNYYEIQIVDSKNLDMYLQKLSKLNDC